MPIDHAFVEAYFVPLQLALAMFGMGATLTFADFGAVVRDPRGLALGLVLQLGFVPAFAWVFVTAFDLGPGWAVGLSLVAVVPGGAFSNLLTFFGRGNVALSIALTVAATAGCIATVPLLLRLLAGAWLPPDFSLPTGRIVFEIFVYLLIPLALGMVARRAHGGFARVASTWAIRGSLLLIAMITVSALGSGRIRVPEYGWRPPLLLILFGTLLAIIVPHITRAFGRRDPDTVAIAIEVCVRNIGIALLLVRFFFPGRPEHGHVLYTCLFYAGMSGFLTLVPLVSHRLGRSPVLLRRPSPQYVAPNEIDSPDP